MEKKKNQTYQVIGIEDKRQITIVVSFSADGSILPLQLVL